MALELDPHRRRQSDTLPSMYTDFERTTREGEQYHRRNHSIARHSISTASPVSPTTTMYGPSPAFPPKYPLKNDSYTTPPDSRKNSEDEKGNSQGRLSLPSLHEVGLAAHPPPPLHPLVGPQYPHHPHSHHSLPAAHSLPPSHSLPPTHPGPPPPASQGPHYIPPHQHPQPYHPQQQSSTLPPAGHHSELSPYRYHESRSFSESHPSSQPLHPPQQPPHDQYRPQPQSHPYPPPPPPPPASGPYSPHAPSSSNGSFNYTPTSAQSQYQYPPPPPPSQTQQSNTQSPYASSMPPPYAPPYTGEPNSAHPPGYANGSPRSKGLGKRPGTYGNAIDRALQVSSVRRDLELVRNNSKYIYNLVQPFYEKGEGSPTYEHQSLDQVLAGFQKAIQDAEALKEGLENCRRTLADMSKEHEERIQQKGRALPEYEAEEHVYGDEGRSVEGSMQPELKKIRRGRAAPPGRCHSCHRAETPEWRRGPDGARTLCNACGLHYAKLTRKMSKNNLAPGSMTRKPPTSHDMISE